MTEVSSPILGVLYTMWGCLPNVLAAVLTLLACCIGSSLAKKAPERSGHKALAMGCQIGIYATGGFMILSELGIAQELVNAAFILCAGALSAAFALAFGIGGRTFAGHVLEELEGSVSEREGVGEAVERQ